MSLGPDEFIAMVQQIRDVSRIQGNGQKNVSETEMITRNKYHVSIASVVQIKSGTILDESMISYRNPGTGIPAKDAHKIIGKKVVKDIPEDILLNYDMFK